MTPADVSPPKRSSSYWVWSSGSPETEILFVGRGPRQHRNKVLRDVFQDPAPPVAWLRQTHSARVRTARRGACGDGDALVTGEHDLALSVATADCLPIVIAAHDRLAVVHAGWRGLTVGIIPATVAALPDDPGKLRAWIGPAIGPCCYQVGEVVAREVAEVSAGEVVVAGTPRPHLDLFLAAELQLASVGVDSVQKLEICTRCTPDWLWSFRREGPGCGRNWTFAWRRTAGRRI